MIPSNSQICIFPRIPFLALATGFIGTLCHTLLSGVSAGSGFGLTQQRESLAAELPAQKVPKLL